MGWSNDELNEIYIYDPLTGQLILRVDSSGFFYQVGESTYLIDSTGLKARLTADNGSYISMLPRDIYDGVRLVLQPPQYPPGVDWPESGRVFAGYDTLAGPEYQPFSILSSPGLTLADVAQIQLYAATASNPSVMNLTADEIRGRDLQQMSLGTLDTYVGTSFQNFSSATFVPVDWTFAEYYGNGMATDRIYEASFAGTLTSSTVNDRIGLRVYVNTSPVLAGATLVADLGQARVDVANIPQPFRVDAEMVGVTGTQYLILMANRTAGAGNCNVTTTYRRLADLAPV